MWSISLALACSSGPLRPKAVPDQVHAYTFSIRTPQPQDAQIRCEASDDPDEIHVVDGHSSELFTLYGLLADTTYVCTGVAGSQVSTTEIHTDPLPHGMPSWELSATIEGDQVGYTVMNHGTDLANDRQPKILILDGHGRLRWSYTAPYPLATDLDVTYLGNSEILYGGGYVAPPTIIGLDGEVRAQVKISSSGGTFHHHVERLDNHEVAAIASAPVAADGVGFQGFVVDVYDPTLRQLRWTFHAQEGVDAGWLPPGDRNQDAYHANALVFHGDDLLISLKHLDRIVAIHRPTRTLRWSLGVGQDFTLTDVEGIPLPDNAWFQSAHAPEMSEDTMLLYDNNVLEPDLASRIVELQLDEDAGTARVTWQYAEVGWFEPIWGDVDRLPNGQIFIVKSHCDSCRGSTEATTELVQVDRGTGTPVWRLTFDSPNDAVYRAQRVPGCDLFANRKYCVSPD